MKLKRSLEISQGCSMYERVVASIRLVSPEDFDKDSTLTASLLEGGDNLSMTLGGDGDDSISGFVACWWQGSSGSWGLRSMSQRDPHRYNVQSLWLISKLGCLVRSRKTPLFPRKNSLQTLATIPTGFLLTAWFCNLKKYKTNKTKQHFIERQQREL